MNSVVASLAAAVLLWPAVMSGTQPSAALPASCADASAMMDGAVAVVYAEHGYYTAWGFAHNTTFWGPEACGDMLSRIAQQAGDEFGWAPDDQYPRPRIIEGGSEVEA